MLLVEENGFAFTDESDAALDETLFRVSELLDWAHDARLSVLKWSELWMVQSQTGRPLHELLFNKSSVDADLRRLVASKLDRIGNWDDGGGEADISVVVEGDLVEIAPSLGHLLRGSHNGSRGCLTTVQSRFAGQISVAATDGGVHCPVFIVREAGEGPEYLRYSIVEDGLSPEAISEVAAHAFPRCTFGDRTWREVNSFDGKFVDLRATLVLHLAVLNDHAPRIWKSSGESHVRIAELASLGIESSPESPQTHRNRKAMSQREATFGDRKVTCEWHTKFEPTRNRIHFEVSGDEVLIGIFTDHLGT